MRLSDFSQNHTRKNHGLSDASIKNSILFNMFFYNCSKTHNNLLCYFHEFQPLSCNLLGNFDEFQPLSCKMLGKLLALLSSPWPALLCLGLAWPVLLRPGLPCSALAWPGLHPPCPALPCPPLPRPALPCPAQPCPAFPWLISCDFNSKTPTK